jgi:hypothetical protein
MIWTVLTAFVAGFFVGNGLPYYVAGSTGESVNPSPFPKSPSTNVVVGWAGMLLGGVVGYFTDWTTSPVWALAAAMLGALAVGLVHARLWRADPWRRRTAPAAKSETGAS